jgi:hypothetical protein
MVHVIWALTVIVLGVPLIYFSNTQEDNKDLVPSTTLPLERGLLSGTLLETSSTVVP